MVTKPWNLTCSSARQRIPIRLIVYRLPSDVYRKRQKAAIKAAKRKGRGISLSYLKFLKYTFFITNVPAALWSMEVVGTIYRLRWQVELVFKNWKSLFQINVLKGTRPERILCLIYGRLIVILVVQRLLALASVQAAAEQRELSFCKASQWLMRGGRLLKAFLDRQFGDLLRRMLSCLRRTQAEAKAAHDVAIDCAASGVFGQLCGCRPLRQRGVDPGWLCLA